MLNVRSKLRCRQSRRGARQHYVGRGKPIELCIKRLLLADILGDAFLHINCLCDGALEVADRLDALLDGIWILVQELKLAQIAQACCDDFARLPKRPLGSALQSHTMACAREHDRPRPTDGSSPNQSNLIHAAFILQPWRAASAESTLPWIPPKPPLLMMST